MKQFKDFGIATEVKSFVGDKIKMERILNREIQVLDFKMEDSKFEGKCLHLQIAIGETKHVVFSGSAFLMDIIQKIPKPDFPFVTTIIKTNDHFEFS